MNEALWYLTDLLISYEDDSCLNPATFYWLEGFRWPSDFLLPPEQDSSIGNNTTGRGTHHWIQVYRFNLVLKVHDEC
jgi:hypothetical protein